MMALEEMTPKVEQYSIDEMFLDLTGIDGCEDFEHFGRRLRAHVLATTGLTVGVGMGRLLKPCQNRRSGPAGSGRNSGECWR